MKCTTCKIKEVCNIYGTLKSFGLIITVQVETCLYFSADSNLNTDCQNDCCTNNKGSSATVDHISSLVKSVLETEDEPYYVPSPLKNLPVVDDAHCYMCGELKTDECSICHKSICDNHAIAQLNNNEQPIFICENCFSDVDINISK